MSIAQAALQVLVPYAISDTTLVSSSVAENDYAVWSAATVYAVGTRVIRTQTHRIYERLTAGSSTAAPEDDHENWYDVAATNRWAMFDQAVGSVTSALTGPITVQLNMPGPVNDVVLLGVIGTSVNITLPGANRTVAVPGSAAALLVEGLASPGGTLTLTISGPGIVGLGTFAAGNFTSLAYVVQGVQAGITDFSKKGFDAFGQPEIVRRSYLRRLTLPVSLAAANFDQVVRILSALRSTPVVWRGVPWLQSTLVYGWPKDWSLKLDTATQASGSISLESLALGLLS